MKKDLSLSNLRRTGTTASRGPPVEWQWLAMGLLLVLALLVFAIYFLHRTPPRVEKATSDDITNDITSSLDSAATTKEKRKPEEINYPPERMKHIPATFLSSDDMKQWLTFANRYKCEANDSHYMQIQRDLYPFGIPEKVKARAFRSSNEQEKDYNVDKEFASRNGITKWMVDRAFKHLKDTVRYSVINGSVHADIKVGWICVN